MIGRRLFLIDTRLTESEIRARFPKLWAYLEKGEEQGLPARYLCSHRFPWYSQENRPLFDPTLIPSSQVRHLSGTRKMSVYWHYPSP